MIFVNEVDGMLQLIGDREWSAEILVRFYGVRSALWAALIKAPRRKMSDESVDENQEAVWAGSVCFRGSGRA